MEQPLFCPKPSFELKLYKEPFEEENNWVGKRRLCPIWTLQSLAPALRLSVLCSSGAHSTPCLLAPSLGWHPWLPPPRESVRSPGIFFLSSPLLPVILLRGHGNWNSRLPEPRVEPCPETLTSPRKFFKHRKQDSEEAQPLGQRWCGFLKGWV